MAQSQSSNNALACVYMYVTQARFSQADCHLGSIGRQILRSRVQESCYAVDLQVKCNIPSSRLTNSTGR
jgi:hypothetical protein